jgi:hypothetical protein
LVASAGNATGFVTRQTPSTRSRRASLPSLVGISIHSIEPASRSPKSRFAVASASTFSACWRFEYQTIPPSRTATRKRMPVLRGFTAER